MQKFIDLEDGFQKLHSGEITSVNILTEGGDVYVVTSEEFRKICSEIPNLEGIESNAAACDEGGLCNRWFRLSDAWLSFTASKKPIMTGVVYGLSSYDERVTEFLMSEGSTLKVFIKDPSEYDEDADFSYDGGVYELSRETFGGFFGEEKLKSLLSIPKGDPSTIEDLLYEDVDAKVMFVQWYRNTKSILQVDQVCL